MKDFPCIYSSQILLSFQLLSLLQKFLLPWTRASCFKMKKPFRSRHERPHASVVDPYSADACTLQLAVPCFDCTPDRWMNSWGPMAMVHNTNFNSQIHCIFSFKSSFYFLFLCFSDKNQLHSQAILFCQSIYKYKPLYCLPFQMSLSSEAHAAILLNVMPSWRSSPTSYPFLS